MLLLPHASSKEHSPAASNLIPCDAEPSSTMSDPAEAQTLLQHRKLILVLDLDQTLFHSTPDDEEHLVSKWLSLPPKRLPPALQDVSSFVIADKVPSDTGNAIKKDMTYFLKPRPGLPSFLSAAAATYELWAFTAGTRQCQCTHPLWFEIKQNADRRECCKMRVKS